MDMEATQSKAWQSKIFRVWLRLKTLEYIQYLRALLETEETKYLPDSAILSPSVEKLRQ